ncbi:MAG: Gfo/Idh/MocA family oxidoreductase [Pyrinomonadaceae bacterium]|nr:Gfo/Idh/MocA family oxidoreductase [Pyrinomonadaceae bacterium]
MRRRDFIVGAAAFTAISRERIHGANDRIGMALIGGGRRGREVMKAHLSTGRVELSCICDVYDVQRGRAREALAKAGEKPYETTAIEDALDRRDVDAVLIASPDHLHLTQTAAALRAGKHVYLEKPTTHDFDDGEKFIAAVKASGRVLQTGTQQRSGTHYRQAKEDIFERCKLGQVIFARAVWSDFPWQRRKIEPQPRPAGLQWERFIGPAKKVPFEWVRYDAWRYFPDYGGGLLADILTHWADVAQWMMDEPAPESAVATGGIYQLRDGRVNPDTVNAILQYKGGWNLTFESTVLPIKNERASVFFEGTDGTLDIARDGYIFRPNKGVSQVVKSTENLEVAHATSFLDAVKNGALPSAPIQIGVEACNPVHLAKAAYWHKKRMRFDADGKKIVSEE